MIRPSPFATQLLSATAKGRYCQIGVTLYVCPVDVFQTDGTTKTDPETGMIWIHDLLSGQVGQVADQTATLPHGSGGLDQVEMRKNQSVGSLTTSEVTVADCPEGCFFRIGADLYRVVTVVGQTADSGKTFTQKLTTGDVKQLASATACERSFSVAIEWILKN